MVNGNLSMMKNKELVDEAMKLLPEVKRTKVFPEKNPKLDDSMGKGDVVEIDFGKHIVGYLKLRLGYVNSHPDAPIWLKFTFAESKKELAENVETYHGWICSSWVQQEQIHVDVVPGMVDLPRRYAFRYVKLEVLDISDKFRITIDEISADAVSSADDGNLFEYQNPDTELQMIDHVACNTLHDCMQKVFEDGPKRDRRLWIGDLRLQALVNYQTYQMNDMVKGCLYLFAGLPMENGQVGACVFLEPEPEVDDTCMFDYSLIFILAVWDYFKETGDKEALFQLWPTVKKQIEIAEQKVNRDGIVEDSDVIGWCFLDWSLELNKQAGAQGVFLCALKTAAQIAEAIEDPMAEGLKKRYECCRQAAIEYFWDDTYGVFVSGKDRQVSFASQVWLILAGCVSEEKGIEILKTVEAYPDAIPMITPYMYHYYIQAYILCGKKEKALEIMKMYWGGMIKQGADTFWELYNPKNPDESPYGGTIVNSYCHAWSCAPAYFLRKYYKEGQHG